MTLDLAIRLANDADAAWQAHLDACGVDRWSSDSHGKPGTVLRGLYEAKLAADEMMAREFEKNRARAPYVEVDTESAYGSTQRISRSIRVF